MRRTSLFLLGSFVLISLTVAPVLAMGKDAPTEVDLKVLQHIPAEPLAFWAVDFGPFDEGFDGILEGIRRFVPEEERPGMGEKLAEFDANLGFSLRDDLLAHLGPETGLLIDMRPIDDTAGLIKSGTREAIGEALEDIVVWIQTDGDTKIVSRLTRFFSVLGADTEATDDLVQACWNLDETTASTDPPPPCLFLAIGDGSLALGFTAARATEMLTPVPPEKRVDTGGDYNRVVSQLDAGPDSLVYLNLPRVQSLLSESQMMTILVNSRPDAKSFSDLLADPALTPHGYGATSIRVGHGSRKVTFGPEWMDSGLLTVGIVAAIAIPNLINAINRSKQKRTMADIRTVGTCMEAFAVDNMIYPTTDGWVPCSELADQLSPLYIHSLPTTDGWEQPLMCTSDGRNYTIVSGGRDTSIEQNYSMEFESHGTINMDEDIVYRNGVFEIYPSGIQD